MRKCPRCGRYCISYIATSWRTEWKCICGYDSAINGVGIVCSCTTAEMLYNEQALTNLRDSKEDIK